MHIYISAQHPTVMYSDCFITNEKQTLKLNGYNLVKTKRGGECQYFKEYFRALNTYSRDPLRGWDHCKI